MSASSTIDTANRQVLLRAYPSGVPTEDCFEITDAPQPVVGGDELLVRTLDLSLDPYLRTAITGRHLGEPATPLGTVMPGRAVAEVVATVPDGPAVGALVLAPTGWQRYAAVPAAGVTPVGRYDGAPPSAALGPLGMPGLTAYAALTRQIRPRVGDTVVVSSATGAVGSVAGQLASLSGARTVAIVSGAEKMRVAREVFGYDAAVDRTDPQWREALAAAAPDGVDGYLHMGDADVLDGVLGALAIGARVTLCGLMDQYNDGGPSQMSAAAVIRARAIVHGIVVYDHTDLVPEQVRRISSFLRSGDMRMLEDRTVGLENAASAFVRLMSGRNVGKAIVEVGRP